MGLKSNKHGLVSKLGEPNYGSRTDVGRVREHNEDSLVVKNPLYAVFDGMGGHAAGEVASEIAASVVSSRNLSTLDVNSLGDAVIDANLEIIHAAQVGKGKPGMGTTCTAALLNGNKLLIAQVGDSRAYLLHDNKMQQLTRDHSYVADLVEQGAITKDYARIHPDRSKITRALGTDPNMEPDLYEIEVDSGDRLMLCSDGLYSMLTDDDIEHILCAESDPQLAADRLVKEANEWGGHDNITVVVVDVSGFAEIKKKKVARKTKVTATFIVLALLAIIGASAYALTTWISNAAYLGECNGYVAIYHGIPTGEVGGKTDNLSEITDVKISDLDSQVANRIKQGEVKYNSYADAQALVESYKETIESKKQAEKEKQSSSTTETENNTSSSSNSSSSSSSTANSSSSTSSSTGQGSTE